MSRYELLTFGHIGAAMVWVGGAAMLQFIALRTLATRDPLRLVAFMRDVDWVGKRVFTPAALTVVFLGFVLVWDGPWELGMTWIWLSLATFGISFLTGIAFLTPESARIGRQIEAEGPESLAVQARIKRLLNVVRLDLVLLSAIVFLMVTKPGV